MQGIARIHPGHGRVGAGQDRHAGALQDRDDAVGDRPALRRKFGIGRGVAGQKTLPARMLVGAQQAPARIRLGRSAGGERVFIGQHQGRHLILARRREFSRHAPAGARIEGRERTRLLGIAARDPGIAVQSATFFEQGPLHGRAGLVSLHQMLATALAGLCRDQQRHAGRYVSGHRQRTFFRLGEDRPPVRFGNFGKDLDEIGAGLGGGIDLASGVVRRASLHGDTVGQDARCDHPALVEVFAPLPRQCQRIGIGAHLAHASDAVGDKQREGPIVGRPMREKIEQVHVHVDQARDQEPAAAIDALRTRRQYRARIGDGDDATSVDQYGPWPDRTSVLDVDDRHLGDGDLLPGR